MATINNMYDAVRTGNAKVLTYETVKSLRGKKIATLYFGYMGQNGFDEFVVGEIITVFKYGHESQVRYLLREDGTDTYIRHHFMMGNDFLSCSDSDREVYFIELE
jgi:hypothetical protein